MILRGYTLQQLYPFASVQDVGTCKSINNPTGAGGYEVIMYLLRNGNYEILVHDSSSSTGCTGPVVPGFPFRFTPQMLYQCIAQSGNPFGRMRLSEANPRFPITVKIVEQSVPTAATVDSCFSSADFEKNGVTVQLTGETPTGGCVATNSSDGTPHFFTLTSTNGIWEVKQYNNAACSGIIGGPFVFSRVQMDQCLFFNVSAGIGQGMNSAFTVAESRLPFPIRFRLLESKSCGVQNCYSRCMDEFFSTSGLSVGFNSSSECVTVDYDSLIYHFGLLPLSDGSYSVFQFPDGTCSTSSVVQQVYNFKPDQLDRCLPSPYDPLAVFRVQTERLVMPITFVWQTTCGGFGPPCGCPIDPAYPVNRVTFWFFKQCTPAINNGEYGVYYLHFGKSGFYEVLRFDDACRTLKEVIITTDLAEMTPWGPSSCKQTNNLRGIGYWEPVYPQAPTPAPTVYATNAPTSAPTKVSAAVWAVAVGIDSELFRYDIQKQTELRQVYAGEFGVLQIPLEDITVVSISNTPSTAPISGSVVMFEAADSSGLKPSSYLLQSLEQMGSWPIIYPCCGSGLQRVLGTASVGAGNTTYYDTLDLFARNVQRSVSIGVWLDGFNVNLWSNERLEVLIERLSERLNVPSSNFFCDPKSLTGTVDQTFTFCEVIPTERMTTGQLKDRVDSTVFDFEVNSFGTSWPGEGLAKFTAAYFEFTQRPRKVVVAGVYIPNIQLSQWDETLERQFRIGYARILSYPPELVNVTKVASADQKVSLLVEVAPAGESALDLEQKMRTLTTFDMQQSFGVVQQKTFGPGKSGQGPIEYGEEFDRFTADKADPLNRNCFECACILDPFCCIDWDTTCDIIADIQCRPCSNPIETTPCRAHSQCPGQGGFCGLQLQCYSCSEFRVLATTPSQLCNTFDGRCCATFVEQQWCPAAVPFGTCPGTSLPPTFPPVPTRQPTVFRTRSPTRFPTRQPTPRPVLCHYTSDINAMRDLFFDLMSFFQQTFHETDKCRADDFTYTSADLTSYGSDDLQPVLPAVLCRSFHWKL